MKMYFRSEGGRFVVGWWIRTLLAGFRAVVLVVFFVLPFDPSFHELVFHYGHGAVYGFWLMLGLVAYLVGYE